MGHFILDRSAAKIQDNWQKAWKQVANEIAMATHYRHELSSQIQHANDGQATTGVFNTL